MKVPVPNPRSFIKYVILSVILLLVINMVFTFVESDVEVLFCKVVCFAAYHIIHNLPIHLSRWSKVHIVIITLLPHAIDQSHCIDLDVIWFSQGVAFYYF